MAIGARRASALVTGSGDKEKTPSLPARAARPRCTDGHANACFGDALEENAPGQQVRILPGALVRPAQTLKFRTAAPLAHPNAWQSRSPCVTPRDRFGARCGVASELVVELRRQHRELRGPWRPPRRCTSPRIRYSGNRGIRRNRPSRMCEWVTRPPAREGWIKADSAEMRPGWACPRGNRRAQS